MKAVKEFFSRLVRACPSLPFMALGAWLATVYISSSGTAWLSDNEMTGENLSTLFILSVSVSGLVMAAATFFIPRAQTWLAKPASPLIGGAIAAIGCLGIIAVGPYYLTPILPYNAIRAIFLGSCIIMGAGLGVVGLRCAQLYGALPPRQVIIYTAASQVIVALLFFVVAGSPPWAPVAGGPSLAGILWFTLLPFLAGALASLPAFTGVCDNAPKRRAIRTSRRALPRSFWKLLIVVFVFSVIVLAVRSLFVTYAAPDATLDGTRLVMLLRMGTAFLLAIVIMGTAGDGVNFGKAYSIVMVGSVALVACLPLVTALHAVLSHIIAFADFVFELFLWCTLAFIVYQRRISAIIVFGFGYGAFQLGSGLGWALGAHALPLITDAIGETFTYMIMALIVLACAFLIFSEREFDRLFQSEDDEVLSLDELMRQSASPLPSTAGTGGEDSDDTGAKRGRFGHAIDELAETYHLSPRERDVLRCLAMGYNSSTTASKLFISWNTVRTHTRNVYGKLGVHSHQELIKLVDKATKTPPSEE